MAIPRFARGVQTSQRRHLRRRCGTNAPSQGANIPVRDRGGLERDVCTTPGSTAQARRRDIGFMAGELRGADGTVVATATASAIIRQRRF